MIVTLQVFPSIQNSMAAPELFPKVLDTSFTIVAALCSCVGAAGYYMYGSGALDVVRAHITQLIVPVAKHEIGTREVRLHLTKCEEDLNP
jgi:hypothetical protein